MLAIPVSETIDDDSDYYGWTDNITFLRNDWARQKASGNAVNSRNWKSSSIIAGNCNRENLLGNTNNFFEKYDTPKTFILKFNSLRSGPFGSTDPFIIKLFSSYNPNGIAATANPDDAIISNDNEPDTENLSKYLEELFADRFDQALAVKVSQDPVQLREPYHSTFIEKSIYAEQDCFWDMKFGEEKIVAESITTPHGVSNRFSGISNRFSESSKKDKISVVEENDPIQKFPRNYLKLRKNLHENTFAPTGYLQNDFQLVRA